MKIEIKNTYTGAVIFSHACMGNSIKITVLAAISARANLSHANLSHADLFRANLSHAYLSFADLYGADLYGADLSGANLSHANLSHADLSFASLYGANLSGADLSGANLYGADLYGANLSGADLSGAVGNNSRMACLQLGAYKIVVLDCEICWGGCTKKTVSDWLKYKGEDRSESDRHYLQTVTKPFLRMCLKMRGDV